jgi:hypothetical protein
MNIFKLSSFLLLYTYTRVFAQENLKVVIYDYQLFEFPAGMGFNEAIDKDSMRYTGYCKTNTTFTFNFKQKIMIEQFDGKQIHKQRIVKSNPKSGRMLCIVELDKKSDYMTYMITDFLDNSLKDVFIGLYNEGNVVKGWFTPFAVITPLDQEIKQTVIVNKK